MISTRTDMPDRGWELIDGLCGRLLSPAEMRELEGLLRGNPPRQRALLDYCRLHTDLKVLADARQATQLVRLKLRRLHARPSWMTWPVWTVAARPIVGLLRRCGRVVPETDVAVGGLVLLAVAAAFWGILTLSAALLNELRESRHAREVAERTISPPPLPKPLPVAPEEEIPFTPPEDGCSATLTQFIGRWAQPDVHWRVGDRLPVGELALAGGTAELMFDSGACVTLEGPCVFRIEGANASGLRLGKLLAHVSPRAIGFRVNGPQTDVIDLGTEFGMEVRKNGAAEVHVLDGRVQLQPHKPHAVAQVLTKSEAIRLSPDGVEQFRGTAQPSLFRGSSTGTHSRLDEVAVKAYRYQGRIRPAADWHRNDKESTKLIDGERASFDHMDSRWVGFADPTGRDDRSPQPGVRFELPSSSAIDAVRVAYLVMASAAISAPDALRIRAADSEAKLESAAWQTLVGFDNQPNIAGLTGNGSGSVKIVTLDTNRLQGRWVDLEFMNSNQWTYLTEITFLQKDERQ